MPNARIAYILEQAKKHSPWETLRQEIQELIVEIAFSYGGDGQEWLNEYFNDIIDTWKDDLPRALECFKALKKQAEGITRGRPRKIPKVGEKGSR